MAHVINDKIKFTEERIQKATPSTLLIPNKLLKYFESRTAFFGSRKAYFQHLIITYGRLLHHFEKQPFSNKWKNKYQEPGLDLKPQHFTPDPEFWEEFRHISFAYGLTMCHLFVILLKLEHDRWIQAGSPEKFCEKIPRQPQKRQPTMNSWAIKSKNPINTLEGLLNFSNNTILLRKIDFSAMELERMAIISQD